VITTESFKDIEMLTDRQQFEPLQLVTLLREQCELYRRLRRLAARQRELIAGGSVVPLLDLLARRQGLVDQLTDLNRRLTQQQDYWQKHAGKLEPSLRAEANRLVQEGTAILQSIIAGDAEDSKTLMVRKTRTAEQLSSVHVGHHACQAYGAVSVNQSPITDHSA